MNPSSSLRAVHLFAHLSFSAWLAIFAHGANDAMTGMFSALIPGLQGRLALGAAGLSLLVAGFHVTGSLFQPFLGALADRMGHRKAAGWGLATSTVCLSLAVTSSSAWLAIPLVMAGGLGSALLHPASASMAAAAPGRREWVAGLYNGGGLAGMALGPIAGLYLVHSLGTGAVIALMIPGLLLSAFLLLNQQKSGAIRRAPVSPGAWAGFMREPVGALVGAATFGALPFLSFSNSMPLWLVRERNVLPDSPLIGMSLAVLFLASGLGGLLGGSLLRGVRRELLAAGSLLLAPVPFLATLLAAPGSPAYYANIAAAGMLASVHSPLLLVAAQRLAPSGSGAVSGLMLGFANGTAGILFALAGGVMNGVGSAPVMILGYLAALPAAFIAYKALVGNVSRAEPAVRSYSQSVDCPACFQTAGR